jgi:hypothetical protein
MESPIVMTGTWRGEYEFDRCNLISGPVPFSMVLKQRWFGLFIGTVTDDSNLGMPGIGKIRGRFTFPSVRFTKQMPICYVMSKDKRRVTLRDSLAEQGYAHEPDHPHPVIWYTGTVSEACIATGVWEIKPTAIRLQNGRVSRLQPLTGTWHCRWSQS